MLSAREVIREFAKIGKKHKRRDIVMQQLSRIRDLNRKETAASTAVTGKVNG